MNTTVIASISSAAPSRRSDRPYCPALALATTSTGSRRPPGPASLSAAPPGCLPTVPAPAARPLRRPRRPGCPGRRRWPAPRPAVPAGVGCDGTTATMSDISSSVPARITTAWWNSASTANSPACIVAVCEDAARRPAPVRPAFKAAMGSSRAPKQAACRWRPQERSNEGTGRPGRDPDRGALAGQHPPGPAAPVSGAGGPGCGQEPGPVGMTVGAEGVASGP
jgi:hypothetical protein